MKIKTDFVTNSSSTSFIVIDASMGYEIPNFGDVLTVGAGIGETEFGWGEYELYDVGDRINFAFIQAREVKNKKWLEMLDWVIKSNTGVKKIIYNITDEYGNKTRDWGYIDHASSSCEGMNTEMFENTNVLKEFLFGKNSKIVLDNDNH